MRVSSARYLYLAGDGDRGELFTISEGKFCDGGNRMGNDGVFTAGDKGVGRGFDDGVAVFAAVVMSVVDINRHGG